MLSILLCEIFLLDEESEKRQSWSTCCVRVQWMLEEKEEWLLPNQLQQSYADENKMELVLTVEYLSVHSAISHTVGFHPLPPTSNSWVCPLMLPELDFFLPRSGTLLNLSLVLFQSVAEFSQEPPPHSTKTMMYFISANLENVIPILWKNCKRYYFSYHQFPPKLICFMIERYCNTANTTCKQEWRQCHWALLFCLSHLIFIFNSCKPELFSKESAKVSVCQSAVNDISQATSWVLLSATFNDLNTGSQMFQPCKQVERPQVRGENSHSYLSSRVCILAEETFFFWSFPEARSVCSVRTN